MDSIVKMEESESRHPNCGVERPLELPNFLDLQLREPVPDTFFSYDRNDLGGQVS